MNKVSVNNFKQTQARSVSSSSVSVSAAVSALVGFSLKNRYLN